MTSNTDALIAALRTGHDELVALIETLTPEQLTGPSRASEWDLSEVISHLGSGAEIALSSLNHALDPTAPPAVNAEVWDRWNGRSPVERAAAFPAISEAMVSAHEAIDDAARNHPRLDVAFMAWARLNEQTFHSWDIRAQLDPSATLRQDAVALMVDRSGYHLARKARPAEVGGNLQLLVETTGTERTFGVAITDTVVKGEPTENPDATLRLPAEAWLRLATGRLQPDVTPHDVTITGAATLEDLRRVFPGY